MCPCRRQLKQASASSGGKARGEPGDHGDFPRKDDLEVLWRPNLLLCTSKKPSESRPPAPWRGGSWGTVRVAPPGFQQPADLQQAAETARRGVRATFRRRP